MLKALFYVVKFWGRFEVGVVGDIQMMKWYLNKVTWTKLFPWFWVYILLIIITMGTLHYPSQLHSFILYILPPSLYLLFLPLLVCYTQLSFSFNSSTESAFMIITIMEHNFVPRWLQVHSKMAMSKYVFCESHLVKPATNHETENITLLLIPSTTLYMQRKKRIWDV